MACLTGFCIVVNKLISLISSYSGHHYLSFCDNIPPSGQILFISDGLNCLAISLDKNLSSGVTSIEDFLKSVLKMDLPTLSVVIYWFNVYDCFFCAHSTNHELPVHRHNASHVLPHCIVLRPRYCLDRVTPSRVNVLQLKDCKWNCQMNWAIAVVSRKLLIMISFDRTGKFSIVTKKRNHFEPQAFCYFTKNASTSVVDYGTILHRGRKIQFVIISVPIDILLHLKWFFFAVQRCFDRPEVRN